MITSWSKIPLYLVIWSWNIRRWVRCSTRCALADVVFLVFPIVVLSRINCIFFTSFSCQTSISHSFNSFASSCKTFLVSALRAVVLHCSWQRSLYQNIFVELFFCKAQLWHKANWQSLFLCSILHQTYHPVFTFMQLMLSNMLSFERKLPEQIWCVYYLFKASF